MHLKFHLNQLKVLWCFTFAFNALAYNLDTDNPVIFTDPRASSNERSSYFGFSLALYANGEESLLLVGAPRANTSVLQNVLEPGAVYKCPINDKCKEWVIDSSGNGLTANYGVNQIKDNAWIGATIAVENNTSPRVVVCAPRWKNNIININRPTWFMNGMCYSTVAIGVESFEAEVELHIRPLLDETQQIVSANRIGIYNFGMGQAGFSLFMSSNDVRSSLVLGCPGIHNWKGSPILLTETSYNNRLKSVIPLVKNERRVSSGDYFGYTVTFGQYFKPDEYWYASSAPRGANMTGNVFIFSFPRSSNRNFFVKKIISGQQNGEYFGGALASCDVNGNGKDELIVGAPTWSKDTDEGRIYTFTNRFNDNFETEFINGEVPAGRFGTSIVCLGDIDYDGYGDIAVGAPYDQEGGAVYIFNGNKNGLTKKPSQKLVGSQFAQNVRGFGISISEPRDTNGDRHPDIAIGAHLSEHAIFLRSKPVVTVTVNLKNTENKKLLRNSTYFFMDICSSYDGAYVPNSLKVVRRLKIDKMHGRATYMGELRSDSTYELPDILEKGRHLCDSIKIRLKENIQNVIDPIEVSVSLHLDHELRINKSESEVPCVLCPVMNKVASRFEDTLQLSFAVGCGEDNVCTSDLRLALSLDENLGNRYVIGSTPSLKLTINATNSAEPAYQSKVHIYMPEILALASASRECTEERINNTLEVTCDFGNPLLSNKVLVIELDMSNVKYDTDQVTISADLTTQSEELSPIDNSFNLTIHFDADMDIAIAGKAQEDLYSYIDNGEKELDTIRFQHIYEVQKFGVSPIEAVTLTISTPVLWKHASGNVEIASVNQTLGYIDGRQFYCTEIFNSEIPPTSAFINNEDNQDAGQIFDIPSRSSVNNTHEKFSIEENHQINLPPGNRTLFINCSNSLVLCKKIECHLGSFVSSLSVAKLVLLLDLKLINFQPDMMEGKDIVFFVSNGFVNITEPSNVGQKIGHKPDSAVVATTFTGTPISQKIAVWIIALSVILGIVLLVLLILGLIKVGFFQRKKKEELEALKAEADRRYSIVLETTSSKEVLDQE